MPLHPVYGRLTGLTRLRRGWRGRLIVQVQTYEDDWKDATERELNNLGFEASSEKGRREQKSSTAWLPPLDWTTADLPGLKWR